MPKKPMPNVLKKAAIAKEAAKLRQKPKQMPKRMPNGDKRK